MALVWLYSRQIPLALLPFTVYSVFHIATYTKSNLIPTFQPGVQPAKPASPSATSPTSLKQPTVRSPLAETLTQFTRQYYEPSMGLVATLEVVLLFRLVLSALTFSRGSWVLLLAYLSFFRSRYAQSSFVQQAVRHLTARADTYIAHQSTPPSVRQGWEMSKRFVQQGYEATDLARYVYRNGPAAGAKKPQ